MTHVFVAERSRELTEKLFENVCFVLWEFSERFPHIQIVCKVYEDK